MNLPPSPQSLLKKKILQTASRAVDKRTKKFSKKERELWRTLDSTKKEFFFSLSNPGHVHLAARGISLHAPMIYHFGNFIAIASHPNKKAVEYVNFTKGRNRNQTGSITTIKRYLKSLFDWTKVPSYVDQKKLIAFIEEIGEIGPFGFRGPAAKNIPKHLSILDGNIRTVQVIIPGWSCPSNHLIEEILETINKKFLYATSPNLSHHLTGESEEPAHYKIRELQKDFNEIPGYFIVAQEDEDYIQNHYPHHEHMSTSILAFHNAKVSPRGKIRLILERHGSFHINKIKKIAKKYGFEIVKSEAAKKRLLAKKYS